MTKLENEIVESVKRMHPINEYGYKVFDDLKIIVAEAMGYKTYYVGRGNHRHKTLKNNEDWDMVYEFIRRMVRGGIIKVNKTGLYFKLIEK